MVGDFVNGPFGSQVEFSHYEPITETFGLIARAAEATRIAAVRDMQAAFEGARRYHFDAVEDNSWWMEANADTESVRRTLLYDGTLQVQTGIGYDSLLDCGASAVQVTMTRHPFWENVAESTAVKLAVNAFGGTWEIAGITGDVPSRICRATIKGYSGSGGPLVRGWMGIREEYEGTTNFDPIIELETTAAGSGHAYYHSTDTSNSGSDATCSNSYYAICDFSSDTTLIERVGVRLYEVAYPNTADYVGKYLVLCRCKATSGTIGLQLKSGWQNSDSFVSCDEVFIDNTNFQLIPLGEVQFPPNERNQIFDMPLLYMELQLWAERVAGTGSLYADALCLIPSTHMIYFDNGYVYYTGGVYSFVDFFRNERDVMTALSHTVGYGPNRGIVYEDHDWYLPIDDSVVAFAAERSTQCVITDTANLQLNYFPRWMTYREGSGT